MYIFGHNGNMLKVILQNPYIMKFKLLLLMLFLFNLGYSQDGKLVGHEVKYVEKIISLFKQNNINAISSRVHLPLTRENPIPSINDEKELKARFNEVFDEKFMKEISNSKIEQWTKVRGKGIMFEDGILWMDSVDGKIFAVNHIGDLEKKFLQGLIDKERDNLFASLRDFQTSIYKIRTARFLIRIDELPDSTYRYAAWKITEDESTEPELVLTDGKIDTRGSEGNHSFVFTDNSYTYNIFRNTTNQDRPDITIVVEKDGRVILAEDGDLME